MKMTNEQRTAPKEKKKQMDEFLKPFVDMKRKKEQEKEESKKRRESQWNRLDAIRKIMKPAGEFYPYPRRFDRCPKCGSRLTKERVSICGNYFHGAFIYRCPDCFYVYAEERCCGHEYGGT